MRGFKLADNVDLLILALALPLFLVAGFPIMGWVGGTGLWLLQRLLRAFLEGRAKRSTDVRTMVGLTAGSMIGRGWLVAFGLMGLYALTDAGTALAASVLFLFTFTFFFTFVLLMRPLDRKEPRL